MSASRDTPDGVEHNTVTVSGWVVRIGLNAGAHQYLNTGIIDRNMTSCRFLCPHNRGGGGRQQP